MNLSIQNKSKKKFSLEELILLTMFGTMIYLSDLLMEALMNVEMVSMLIVVFTVVYRARALVTIYVYVGLYLLTSGLFAINLGYLYIWLVLFLAVMLIPRRFSGLKLGICCTVISTLFGLAFGLLYTPMWVMISGMSLRSGIVWWIAGLPADGLHAAGNFAFSFLCVPLITVLLRLEARRRVRGAQNK